ncbi:hypothetical protein [Photobacterium kishitanii]|uniref:Flagellin n=1 Tax=Photobacterium kishitanii TaxID=318456 RepID=A0A2T3KMU0_9GAMM|nr:hypothetical protein [Photobacterium kishitanii]PSV01098.1 hypothetical protein C9J27_03505 [Photobacterium kishitanii]
MRITTNNMFAGMSENMGSHFSAIGEQMKRNNFRVIRSGDDPIMEGRIINLQKKIGDIDGYKNASNVLNAKLGEIDLRVKEYGKSLNTVNTLFQKVSSGTMNTQDLIQMANQFDDIEGGIVQLLNMKNAHGDFVFSGTKTTTEPLVKETKVVNIDGTPTSVEVYAYKGNGDRQQTKVGLSQYLPSTVAGDRLITDGNGNSIFETLAKVKHYLRNGQTLPDSIKDEVNKSLDGLLDSKIHTSSEIGIATQESQRSSDIYSNMHNQYTELLSNSRDADYISVATEIKKQQQIMKSLASSSKVLLEMAQLRINN